MKKILGLDNGYKFTKTDNTVCFASTIKEGIDHINNVIQTEIDGRNYIVGEETGQYIADADKLKSAENREVLKVTTLTAIALSFPEEDYIELDLVVGLPAGQFEEKKDALKHFMKNIDSDIFVNKIGRKQTIKINEVFVFPQSAGIVFKDAKKLKDQTSIIIDIGGGTWDVSEFDGLKMVNKQTYQEGMIVLEEKIAQFLNAKYDTNYKANNIYNLYKRGFFTADGRKQSMTLVDDIIKAHINEVITPIKRSFNVSGVDNIFLIGGGAEVLNEFITDVIKNAELQKDAQFVNAECFKVIGEMKLSK